VQVRRGRCDDVGDGQIGAAHLHHEGGRSGHQGRRDDE
jgi:hypothetical protein